MDWTLKTKDKAWKISLPAQLPASVQMRGTLGPQMQTFTWEPRLKTLFVQEAGSRFERCLRVRTHRIQNFPGEPTQQVHFELASCPAFTLKATVSPLAYGEAARQTAQVDKGLHVRSPMTGKVLKVLASKGQKVETGEALLIIEAMKMENRIAAPLSGLVQELKVKAGDLVQVGAELAILQR